MSYGVRRFPQLKFQYEAETEEVAAPHDSVYIGLLKILPEGESRSKRVMEFVIINLRLEQRYINLFGSSTSLKSGRNWHAVSVWGP